MCKGPLLLWLLSALWRLYLTPAAAEFTVRAYLGQPATLPCVYPTWSRGSNTMCWGKGACPNSKCNEELLHTDGTKVISRRSLKYDLLGNIWRGDVSLTIFNANEGDSAVYCCRIEVPGWFNDVKTNIRLRLMKAPTTTPTTTTTTTPTTTTTTTTPTTTTTTTAALPTTAVTTPGLTTRTLQARTTTALATVATTCPLTTPGALPETTTALPTTEPSTEGSALTAESETLLLSEVTSGNTTLLTPKESETHFLSEVTSGNTTLLTPKATEMTDFVDEAEAGQVIGMDSAFLAKIIASSLGFVLCALIVGLFLRGKVMKTNCFQKHTRLHNPGESKNVLDDIQHGREDEEGLFTL